MHHLTKTAMTDFVAGSQSEDITNELVWFTNICLNDFDKCFINCALVNEFHNRQIKTFLIDGIRICPKAATANIDNMCGAGKKANKLTFEEGGGDHRDVMQMSRTFPGVIGNIDITFFDVICADAAYEMCHSICHRIHMTRGACHSLCKHQPLRIIDTCR